MERGIGEIFFDGNVKLEVREARTSISCKDCFYNVAVRRKDIKCTCESDKCYRHRVFPNLCKSCRFYVEESVSRWECHRNWALTGNCQRSFRDDGKSVVFVEVCG